MPFGESGHGTFKLLGNLESSTISCNTIHSRHHSLFYHFSFHKPLQYLSNFDSAQGIFCSFPFNLLITKNQYVEKVISKAIYYQCNNTAVYILGRLCWC